jgi:tetratricopeptide (TPR) repeat protein
MSAPAGFSAGAPSPLQRLLATYDAEAPRGEASARERLLAALAEAAAPAWLEAAQQLVLRRRVDTAAELLAEARRHHPQSGELAFALAGLERQRGRFEVAEALLREALSSEPGHAAAALTLARLLGDRGCTNAAAGILRVAFIDHRQPINLAIKAMELLDELERKADAAAIAEAEIAAGCTDPRMHAYAATYAIQLGEFERARERYLYAWAHSPQAADWNVPFGLASSQRYRDAQHPDFALFAECLARPGLADAARVTLLFALGKAFDDIGDYARAAGHFREANALANALWPRSRKQWRRSVAARIQAPALPLRREPTSGFTPVFIVGVPRSGTTLTAELLARRARVCNRGELRWMWRLSQRLPATGAPDGALLDTLAAEYEAHLRQDDGGDAHWFIDKQPMNLVHLDLIFALWPHARIIHCQRNARDNALSLWVQSFHDDTYALASDFADIAALQQGCAKLMEHWHKRYPASIRSLRYEDLAADPAGSIGALADWLGLPTETQSTAAEPEPRTGAAINTASLWQARQPVYTRSIGRWRNYAPFVPELLEFQDR